MYIKVRVKTNARKEAVVKENHDHYIISVREKAERNMANKRILDILRDLFSGTNIRIIHGHQSPSKLVAIDEEND